MQKGLRKILLVPAYMVGFLVVGLVSGYFTFQLMSFSKTVAVPDLKGKNVIEANEALSKIGLYLKIEGEDYDPLVLPGRIVRQDVPAGNTVKEQRGIKVFLSRGPKVQSIPDLVGQDISEAQSLLTKSGLRIDRIIRVHSAAVKKDIVISQKPAPDEPLKESLTLVVSLGNYDILYSCPDFSGKSLDEATKLAGQLGLNVELAGRGDWVKTQKPKPGVPVRSGGAVTLQLGDLLDHLWNTLSR